MQSGSLKNLCHSYLAYEDKTNEMHKSNICLFDDSRKAFEMTNTRLITVEPDARRRKVSKLKFANLADLLFIKIQLLFPPCLLTCLLPI